MVLETAADRVAIRELIDRYHAAVNGRDWDLLADVFAPDAIWEALPPINLRFEGHAAVMDGLKQSVSRQELLIQSCSGVVVDLTDPVHGSVRSTLIEIGREKGSSAGWLAAAFYNDEVRKDDGEWRFIRRTLSVRYLGDPQLSGEVFPLVVGGRSTAAATG